MRYSLKRAIHNEFYLRLNREANAPKLIIQDLTRVRDYWVSKLSEEEKAILEREVVARLTYVPTEEERSWAIPSKGDTGRVRKKFPKNVWRV